MRVDDCIMCCRYLSTWIVVLHRKCAYFQPEVSWSDDHWAVYCMYRMAQKFGTRFITSSNFDQFSNFFFHCQHQEKICNNTIIKDPFAPQVCCYTTLWNVSVLKATTENKTTSVTTHFKSASSRIKTDILNILCKNCRMWQLFYTITETINTWFLLLIS